MSNDYFNPPNSVWPNGLKRDGEGYVTFYPTGTNKVDISTITWPVGDKLVSPFVYQNNELVGFVDTKALTVSGSATTTMNYNHIEADFASISEGKLTVNAPNATVKKFTWAVSTGGDESFDFVIIDFATADQTVIDTVRIAKRVVDNKLYDADDNLIGTWNTSKIEVGGVYDEEAQIADGLFFNMDSTTGEERGLILSKFNSDLSNLVNGSAMFSGCPLTSFNSDLSSLTNGEGMFAGCSNLTSFSADLSSLTNGFQIFAGCSNLTSFSSNLSSLREGMGMFMDCTKLTSFNSDLSSLTNGYWMFAQCDNLTSFTSDLSSLTNSYGMFIECINLTSFSADLSSLTNGEGMFNLCINLASFNSNLSNLTNGAGMFMNCTRLTSFSSGLSSLTDGQYMFNTCRLDASSVKNIIGTINTHSGKLTLGMGCDNTTEDADLFAQEVGYADMSSLLAALKAKGWNVTAQYNYRPTTTYTLRRPTEDTLPIFAKLEEVEETNNKLKSYYTYTSEDGSKKYRLNYFHETTGSTEGYTQFASLEEAVAHYNIKPIERN